jgi:hypothetical protein
VIVLAERVVLQDPKSGGSQWAHPRSHLVARDAAELEEGIEVRGIERRAHRFHDPTQLEWQWAGDYDLPAPDRDLDVTLGTAVANARSVRFTSLADESSEPGFSELEVFGP